MILGFLGLHALITNSWIVPQIPQEPASRPYAVAVPGPYYLAAPGQWTQDSYAQAFGYRFDYHPNTLEVSQYQVTGHPTWLKFFGVNSYPMRFAPHFDSTIHVHFTSNDVRTDLGFVVNDFLKEQPSDLVGPQIRLSASGLWTVYESNGNHYSGQVDQGNLSLDYTLEMEVNGALCTYRINGKEVTTIADAALSSVKDVMLSIASLAPGGATYNLSNFTYTPMPGPGLSRDEASKLVAAGDTAPYTTVAPGWNCNPDDGRWNARYEPAQQNANVICSPAGTQLNASGNSGAALYFDDHRFGELPQAFDYSFDATFQGTGTQCIELQTFAMVTPTGIAYAYVFLLCSNGNWEIKHVGFHTADFSIFFMQQLQSGHIAVNKTLPIFVEYRSTVQRFYMGKQLVASYEAEDLQPTILFTNDQGPVLYSNFSYNPATQ